MTSQGIGRVVHFTPGRLRLRIERTRRTPAIYDEVRGLLAALPGVDDVEVSRATGSILVSYDPSTLDVAQLLRLGAELGWISPNGDGTQPLPAAPSLADWRSLVDIPRARQALTLLGVASLGALAGPAIGVGSRIGSLSASIGYVALRRWLRSARSASHLS